jgi:hypothetical protein
MNRSSAKWITETIQCRNCYERVPQTEVGKDFLCIACHQHKLLFPTGERFRQRRHYEFLTTQILRSVPALYATENVPLCEKMIHAHYFIGGCDWYLAELDPETGLAFGYADPGCGEWGYFDLVEMEQTLVKGWMVIDRELGFVPKRVTELGIA